MYRCGRAGVCVCMLVCLHLCVCMCVFCMLARVPECLREFMCVARPCVRVYIWLQGVRVTLLLSAFVSVWPAASPPVEREMLLEVSTIGLDL